VSVLKGDDNNRYRVWLHNSLKRAIYNTMKNNISITIDEEILEEIKTNFPNQKRSQVIEEALSFWNDQKKKNQLKKDAFLLKNFMSESMDIENESIDDGLHDI
jgi:hypothetical protein